MFIQVRWFDSPELIPGWCRALNEVYFPTITLHSIRSVVQNFIGPKKSIQQPDAFHALGYDLAKFIVEGVERAEN